MSEELKGRQWIQFDPQTEEGARSADRELVPTGSDVRWVTESWADSHQLVRYSFRLCQEPRTVKVHGREGNPKHMMRERDLLPTYYKYTQRRFDELFGEGSEKKWRDLVTHSSANAIVPGPSEPRFWRW